MKRKNREWEHGGVIFVGCILLGMGIGMLFGRTGAGLFIGAGIGFIAMGLTHIFGTLVSRAFEREEKEEEK